MESPTASSLAGNSSMIHHFKANFELSGFGSPGEALVQTVKELVDNAIDACRRRSCCQDAPTVRVVLRRRTRTRVKGDEDTQEELEEEKPLELQVVDNGVGLADVTKALLLFSSTKSGHVSDDPRAESNKNKNKNRERYAGKYGLGLTLSLLYAQKHHGGLLKVTTATLDSPKWTFTKCDIDLDTGLPRTLYRKSGSKPDSWSQGCGTDMRLLVPGDEDALMFAKPRLKALFARMHLLPNRAAGLSFVCEGCFDDMTIVVPRGGREASPHLLLDNDDLVRAFAKGLTAMTTAGDGTAAVHRADFEAGEGSSHGSASLYSSSLSLPSRPLDADGSGSTLHVDHGREKDKPQCLGRLQQQRKQACCDSRECPSTGAGREQRAATMRASLPLSSSRRLEPAFAEEDVAVFECQVTNSSTWVTAAVAVARAPVPVRPTGFSALEPPTGGENIVPLFVHRFANGVPLLDSNSSAACALVAGAASKYSWRNLGLKISSSGPQRGDGRLRFGLSEAPTPLKVIGGEEWSPLADIKAVHVAIAANSETVPYTSLRKDAIVHKEDLIPLAASSVASMVNRSADVNFKKRCLEALGVGNEYVQERRLSEFLVVELKETIHREEARRLALKMRAADRRAEAEEIAGEKKSKRKRKRKKKTKSNKEKKRDDRNRNETLAAPAAPAVAGTAGGTQST